MLTFASLPDRIDGEEQLEDLMSTPTQAVADGLAALDGDIMILGVAGKVGPTLARMAKRAAPDKRVIGVARFSDPAVRARLESWGVETVTCDLLEREQIAALPQVRNVIFMAGKKFGTVEDPPFAWAMNTYVPSLVGDHFRQSRIVAFSTLCVYPFAPVLDGGWEESVAPTPIGEYANSCAGRERMLQFFTARHGNSGRLIRLNYSVDLRYGVLFDVANWVRDGVAIPLETSHASVVWQGDVNAQVLRSLGHCTSPASPLNMGGVEPTSIRWLAHAFGRRFGRDPIFSGTEQATAWVNNTAEAQRLFGLPVVPVPTMIEWVADWIERDQPRLTKPTRYEVRDGRF